MSYPGRIVQHVFAVDRHTGEPQDLTSGATKAYSDSMDPVVSADGRFVAFTTTASFSGTRTFTEAVMLYDRWTSQMLRVSENKQTINHGELLDEDGARDPSMSSDGRYIAFTRYGLTSGGSLVIYDRIANTWTDYVVGNHGLVEPRITGDGRSVFFRAHLDGRFRYRNGITEFANDLFSFNLSTRTLTQITNDTGKDVTNYRVSADGSIVLYNDWDGVAGASYIYNPKTRASQPLFPNGDPFPYLDISSLSANGLLVAFTAIPPDPNHPGIMEDHAYLFDRTSTTIRPVVVNRRLDPTHMLPVPVADSDRITLSPNGAFLVVATRHGVQMVPYFHGEDELFVQNLATGQTDLLTKGSCPALALPLPPPPPPPAFICGTGYDPVHRTASVTSSDGRFTAYSFNVQTDDSLTTSAKFPYVPRLPYIFVHDSLAKTTERVLIDDIAGTYLAGYLIGISADGRFIALKTPQNSLTWLGSSTPALFDRVTRMFTTPQIQPPDAVEGADIEPSSFTPDMRSFAFQTSDSRLTKGLGYGDRVFLYDLLNGKLDSIDVNSAGKAMGGKITNKSISADGRFVAFTSYNFVTTDNLPSPLLSHVYLRDRQSGATARIDNAPDGSAADADGRDALISMSGRYVTFTSPATNLLADGKAGNVYVYDRETQTLSRGDGCSSCSL